MRYLGVMYFSVEGIPSYDTDSIFKQFKEVFDPKFLGFESILILQSGWPPSKNEFKLYELHDQDGEEISEATLAKLKVKFEGMTQPDEALNG